VASRVWYRYAIQLSDRTAVEVVEGMRARRRNPWYLSDVDLPEGIEPTTDARDRYSIRYYLVAMLFVIFDVETVFMFPWAVIFNKLLLFGLIEMIVFIFILVVGYYYAWQKGALEWV